MYDDFSADYDRFVDWPARLVAELPFIGRRLQAVGARRVLDAACGTGMHALALAEKGYDVAGADLSAGMIERARANAAVAGVDVRFEAAGFGQLADTFAPSAGGFDALLCLGNSLPHVLTPRALAAALADFAACLRPGGLLLVQNRNFDVVLACGERWMPPQAHREGGREWLFLRFYDFEPDGILTFNLATLERELLASPASPSASTGERAGAWRQRVSATRLWPLRREELAAALPPAGFGRIVFHGDMEGAPFDAQASPNLIVEARRTE